MYFLKTVSKIIFFTMLLVACGGVTEVKVQNHETPPLKDRQNYEEQQIKPEKKVIPGINMADTPDLHNDGIHDPDNPGIEFLQNPAQSLSSIPLGRWGEVDWMRALNEKIINPRADISGDAKMQILDLDIIMKDTKSMPYVRFPHKSHTQWLACKNCHPDIFIEKIGANNIKMDDVFKGRFCGACHGRVSFSSYVCQRCHSVPHKGSPPQWWE
ncbi:MAG: hypothetical protein HQL69_01845 [Magnetococcales bacterium]|nr:hypothetical protein [Magnetococcales bacterium]